MSLQVFSKNICHLLDQTGYTTEEFARMVSTPERQIGKRAVDAWRQGIAYPQVETFVRVCQALNFYDMFRLVTQDITDRKILDIVYTEPEAIGYLKKVIKFLEHKN